MNKSIKITYFIDMFNLYSVKILNTVVPISKDNRVNCHIMAEIDMTTGEVCIKYNARRLAKWSYSLINSGIFHELGHIRQGLLPYDTEKQQIQLEQDAELYALKMIKKYFPDDYKITCDYYKNKLKSSWWKKKYPIHYKAFGQIKDYQ